MRLIALSALLTLYSVHSFHVSVVWKHDNGTVVRLPARDFAQLAESEREGSRIEKRNAVRDYKYLWFMGHVYFDIDGRTSNFELLKGLQSAINFFHKFTCIRWHRRIPGDGNQNYVIFTMPFSRNGLCNSLVGKQEKEQFINIDAGCVTSLAKILHEMMHALGFYHTHTRPDRDKYLKVNLENASPGHRKFFEKEDDKTAQTFDLKYDFQSVLQYDSHKWSMNRKPTMQRIDGSLSLGNDIALTKQDVTMIQTLYSGCKLTCRFNNGNCEHDCVDITPGKVACRCIAGFKLNSDQKTCYDFDECAEYNGGCEHNCVPQGNLFRCTCKSGFSLDKDGFSCKADDKCQKGTLKCDHQCIFNRCYCKNGYELDTNGSTCNDIDECKLGTAGCESGCVNTVGSFTCTCPSGKYLSLDGTSCTSTVCQSLLPPQNSQVNCTNSDMVHGVICSYTCDEGFKLAGESVLKCENTRWSVERPLCKATSRCSFDNGGCEQLCYAPSWNNVQCSCRRGFQLQSGGRTCYDIESPTITSCPKDIYVNTVTHKAVASVTWNLPTFTDNDEASIISGLVMEDIIGGVYDIGAHKEEYVISDKTGNKAYCAFKIKVDDKQPPDMFNCPPTQNFTIKGSAKYINVTWSDPSFWDNSGNFTLTTDLPKSRKLQPITQAVHYIAADSYGNSVTCTVRVSVKVDDDACPKFPFADPVIKGYLHCEWFSHLRACTPRCNSGIEFRDQPPTYVCRDGKWAPNPQQHVCSAVKSPEKPPTLAYRFKYNVKCQEPLGNEQLVIAVTENYFRRYAAEKMCPSKKKTCGFGARVKCEGGNQVIMEIVTDEPIIGLPSNYFRKLLPKIQTYQRLSGVFFIIPFGVEMVAPELNSNGLRVELFVDMICRDGDIAQLATMKCYENTS